MPGKSSAWAPNWKRKRRACAMPSAGSKICATSITARDEVHARRRLYETNAEIARLEQQVAHIREKPRPRGAGRSAASAAS